MNYDWLPFAAFVISLISLFLTLLKYFLDWRQTRLKMEVLLHSAYEYPGVQKNILEITFVNKTMHAVSITDLQFYLESQDFTISTERNSALVIKKGTPEEKFYTDGLPINVGPYESRRMFLVMNALHAMWVHDLQCTIFTNKGKKTFLVREDTVKYQKIIELIKIV